MSETRDWLHFAAEDSQVAELTLEAGIYNQTCFHAQQCVEKALKAWLAYHGHAPPRVHQIGLLLKLCPRPLPFPAKLEASILTLDRFYIPTRYPDALPGTLPEGLPTQKDAEEALDLAQQVLETITALTEEENNDIEESDE
jgi:HEPN domain-containing protein